jgi:hypothetical protein
MLGWKHHRHYDLRATFITLALEDGADPDIIEKRVTHTKKSRSAFDGYNRGLQWAKTCAEVSKLKITRKVVSSPAANHMEAAGRAAALATRFATASAGARTTTKIWWRRRESNPRPEMPWNERLRV